MKRYEKMTKEEIIEFMDGRKPCDKCLIEYICANIKINSCYATKIAWLYEEVKTNEKI